MNSTTTENRIIPPPTIEVQAGSRMDPSLLGYGKLNTLFPLQC